MEVILTVVREIRTPRSVGTGGGRPPPVTRWCAVMRIPTATARTRSMRALVLAHRALVSGQRLCRPGIWATHAIAQPDQATRRTRSPAVCPVRALPTGLPLTKVPSLHPLRRGSLGLVRGLPWYYARMCDFSRPCIIGYGSMPSRCGPDGTCLWSGTRSPGSRARSVSSSGSRSRRPPCCLPLSRRRRHPEQTFAAQWVAYAFPCQRFAARLAGRRRLPRGQRGSLLLHCSGLSPATHCRSTGAPRRLSR